MDYPEPPEGGTVLSPYHVCDLTALICLATIVADSSFPALQRLARLGQIQVSDNISITTTLNILQDSCRCSLAVLAKMESCFKDLMSKTFQWKKRTFE